VYEGFERVAGTVETWASGDARISLGAAGSLLLGGNARLARFTSSAMGAIGGLIQAWGAAVVLLEGDTVSWSFPSGVPLFEFSLRLDPLAAVFLLSLGVVAIAGRSTLSATRTQSGLAPRHSRALVISPICLTLYSSIQRFPVPHTRGNDGVDGL